MPEGPSIVILKEEVQQFTGKMIQDVAGNTSIDIKRLKDKKHARLKHGVNIF